MMSSVRPHYRSFLHDSARWNDFAFRPGDIVISTPQKAGTTWMQMICALLIFQDPDLEKPLAKISPWLDMRIERKADIFEQLAAQRHRRFIKTHTPLDGLPIDQQVTYICVGRDPRDIAISAFNHVMNMNFEVFMAALQKAGSSDGPAPSGPPPSIPPTPESFFWHWVDDPTPATESFSSLLCTLNHYEVALHARHQPNVVVMHYGDLKADCGGEMRRLAERLNIEVPEQSWATLVEAASFESMRARAVELAPNSDHHFWKEPRQFFHSGTGGHWREFFDDTARHRYEARIATLASPEVATWAHNGWQEATT